MAYNDKKAITGGHSMLQIRDNVHGDIVLDGMFAHIVNTPEFQRLRLIEQGDFRPVYPGARHDRFAHSLGTYYLAGKFVDRFFRNLIADFRDIKFLPGEVRRLKTTFRYAALLHDVGHAPFSHTTEGFFAEYPDPDHPLIWDQLCDEIKAVASPADYDRFVKSTAKKKGAPHEIVSAILLIRNRDAFLQKKGAADVDLELAARMVIGYTYAPTDHGASPADARDKGLRNCLIQLLNSSILDVDRLDYLGRDTQMSGFTNAPLDLDTLASSVTAVKLEDGWLAPAYRDSALRVFDLMFQAKLSHDAWVLANPAGRYDAALLAHCIRRLDDLIDPDYRRTIFCVEALGRDGVDVGKKHYRLLSDVDVRSDLQARTEPEFRELFTREPGKRRTSAWRSYYEYRHLFGDLAQPVFDFFSGLINYMAKNNIFVFDPASFSRILRSTSDPAIHRAAKFLDAFLLDPNGDGTRLKCNYSVVLLGRSNAFTMKVDPADIRIVFPGGNIPLRDGKYNYSTYSAMTGITKSSIHNEDYFYFFRYGGLGICQLTNFRQKLIDELT